ncbi:hypothetical protein E5288_WYG010395 [Bos mutus]|uniref:Uncharacterized protein n=1 Tax=Bos mutus TaxID=72004 RepID=A0A6B0S440_9CETA|nr:hypothetical protein [Bos mutus]
MSSTHGQPLLCTVRLVDLGHQGPESSCSELFLSEKTNTLVSLPPQAPLQALDTMATERAGSASGLTLPVMRSPAFACGPCERDSSGLHLAGEEPQVRKTAEEIQALGQEILTGQLLTQTSSDGALVERGCGQSLTGGLREDEEEKALKAFRILSYRICSPYGAHGVVCPRAMRVDWMEEQKEVMLEDTRKPVRHLPLKPNGVLRNGGAVTVALLGGLWTAQMRQEMTEKQAPDKAPKSPSPVVSRGTACGHHFTATETATLGLRPESTLPRLENPQLSDSRVEVLELSEQASPRNYQRRKWCHVSHSPLNSATNRDFGFADRSEQKVQNVRKSVSDVQEKTEGPLSNGWVIKAT